MRDRRRRTAARRIYQAGKAPVGVPVTPQHHRRLGTADQTPDLPARQAIRGEQHEPGSLDRTSRRPLRPNLPLQNQPIVLGYREHPDMVRHVPTVAHPALKGLR